MSKSKIAIFVEGQTEQIFLRRLLLFDCSYISFSCVKLQGGQDYSAPFDMPNPGGKIHFLIVDVGGDESVLSAIKEREENLFKRGYSRIIGLRDMFCEAYREKSSEREVSYEINQSLKEAAEMVLSGLSDPSKISYYFAIMEIEAWWLGMHSVFEKLDASLTLERIDKEIGKRLDEVDPEKEFFHPATIFASIMQIAGIVHDKSRDSIERVVAAIEMSDIENSLAADGRESFKEFFTEFSALTENLCCESNGVA